MVTQLIQFGAEAIMLSAEQSIQPPDFNNPKDILQSIIYVIIVTAVIIGLIIVLIKVLAAKNRSLQANRSIKTLSGIHFGQNKSLQIVEIGHAIYIIGVGDNVELIHKIDEADEISYIKQSLHMNDKWLSSGKIINLGQWLRQAKPKETKDEIVEMVEEPSFQDVFHDKMKRIKEQKLEMEKLLEVPSQDEKVRK